VNDSAVIAEDSAVAAERVAVIVNHLAVIADDSAVFTGGVNTQKGEHIMAHGKDFIPSKDPAFNIFFKNVCQYTALKSALRGGF
jgi:hypothetical protein